MNYTKKQLEKMEKEAKKAFPKFREHFLEVHNVKDEKEFTERYKSKVAKNNSKQK